MRESKNLDDPFGKDGAEKKNDEDDSIPDIQDTDNSIDRNIRTL